MSDLVGRHLGRYEIVKLLGTGGMGEVYLAKDAQLGRQVAVKVIAARASGDPTRLARFEQEARAVALLSHPNILDIHDFGVDGGVAYAVMELLEGQNLRERMGGSGLPISKALEIGRVVAEGLAAAHSRGVVHRDIKPENIFITSTGQVKILDFGIAGLAAEAGADGTGPGLATATSTSPGQMMGTVGYMSPEQIRGRPVGARSDIFSLGCVLYEMVSGKRAFRGETSADTLSAILHDDPPPIAASRPETPPALALLVNRCLEKQPEERFESARDVAFALQAAQLTAETVVAERPAARHARSRATRLTAAGLTAAAIAAVALLVVRPAVFGAAALPKDKHLAVTRFEADAGAVDLQVIADGLTEVLRRGLTVLQEAAPSSLWLVSRADAERADVGIRTPQDLSRKFNVTAIVTARLRRHGDRFRLDLAAIDPVTQRKLREISIDDRLSNLSAFQDEPILGVARILGLRVAPEARERLTRTATTMTEAFEAYLKGNGALAQAKAEKEIDEAVGLLETAVSQDPLFAAGRVALARAYLRKFDVSKKPEWADRALAVADRAVKDSGWPGEAYLVLARAYGAAGRPQDAMAVLEKAARAAPSSAAVHVELAAGYQTAKRYDDAERQLRRAVFLQPGYWPPHHALARLYQAQGMYEAAATEDREVIVCAPAFTRGYNNLGAMYHYLGRDDDARDAFERSAAIEPTRSALSNLGALYFDAARFADSAAMFERALKLDDTRYLTWGNLGYAYRYGPTPDNAPRCFRRAADLAEGQLRTSPDDPWTLTYLASYDAMLDRRDEGRKVLERVVAGAPKEKELLAQVAEAFEDVGERDRALDWVARSFEAGESPSRFEGRPTLRGLVADERYRRLADEKRRNP